VVAVKLGLFAINYGTCADPDVAIEVARHAEARGFESVWSGEHIVLPDPRPPGLPFPPTLPLLDTVVALTLIAAHTRTLKIGSGIIIAPLRNPVVLAKELASLDVVSAGRLIVGLGAGYIGAEFESAGVPRTQRSARTDETIGALRALWTMARPSYQGHHATFDGINAYPRPVQQPAPPIVVGGHGPRAFTRAVTLADGWYGFGLDLDETRDCLGQIRAISQVHQRPDHLGRLQVTVTPVGPLDRAAIEQYTELGVDRLVVLPQPDRSAADKHEPVSRDQIMRNIDSLAGTCAGLLDQVASQDSWSRR
jgi:probable F420-dependent oxidoreductase